MSTKKPVKKAAPKKATAKKVVKQPTTKKTVKSSGNKELDKMIAKIDDAKKNGDKSVVVFTTSKTSHKANSGGSGFGASDLKPSLLSAYKHLLVNYDVTTNLVNHSEMAVEWIVKIKK